MGSEVAEAVADMKKLDPQFDIFELEDEALVFFGFSQKLNRKYLKRLIMSF